MYRLAALLPRRNLSSMCVQGAYSFVSFEERAAAKIGTLKQRPQAFSAIAIFVRQHVGYDIDLGT